MGVVNQKGNVITYVIIAMSMIAALALGALYMTSSSSLGELGTNNVNRAYFLALAGKEYALINNLGDTATAYPTGRDFTLTNGDIFRLNISGNTIASTGIVSMGTPFEARRTITITKSGFSSKADISGFADMTPRKQPGSSFVQVNVTGTTASMGGWESGKFGALWYSGGAVQGNCTGGKCSFGQGFRAFFVFQFDAGSSGDGFTFTFFNGDPNTNDINSVGGHFDRGELMAYAGDSRIDSGGSTFLDSQGRIASGCLGSLGCQGGRGIQQPKVAIEFDSHANFGPANVCFSDSRCDGNNAPPDNSRNHIAYVFWGDNMNSSCTSTIGRNTYDDNRHNNGADTPTEPRNSRRPSDGADTSYFDASLLWPSNTDWLLNNTPTNIYAFRIEVTRSSTPNVSGNYDYAIKSWVKQCLVNDIACPTYDDASNYSNTKINYNDVAPGDAPTLSRTFALSSAYHLQFGSFYFGWTAATGSATQNVILRRYRMNFLK